MLVALLGVQDELMNLKVKSGLASPTLPEKGQKKKKRACTNTCEGKPMTDKILKWVVVNELTVR